VARTYAIKLPITVGYKSAYVTKLHNHALGPHKTRPHTSTL